MIVIEQHDPTLYARVQERKLVRQYDLLTNCVEIGLRQGHTSFDKYVLWALNHVAVANISQFGGRFREEPIYVGNHKPPHFKDVPELMDRFISTIHENWFEWSPTELAAYGLWRLLWIHPFTLLPGNKIVPERIRDNRQPYYDALRDADIAWDQGNLDFARLEAYLAQLLQDQLSNAP